jgi:hypothetical protein
MERFDRKQAYAKWIASDKGKLSVATIGSEDVRLNTAVLMENQERLDERELYEDNTTVNFGSNAGDGARFSPIALALVRRTFPDLFAHKVIGVQAMNAPVGLAYALRYAYDNNTAAKNAYGGAAVPGGSLGGGNPWFNGGVDDYEAGFRKLSEYSGWTGTAELGTSGVLSPAAVLSAYDLSGANVGKFGTGAATSAAEAWLFRDGSMPKVKLYLDKTPIEAIARKLGASFSLEAAQDLKSMQGIEIEREMLNILNYEVAAELDREILGKMLKASVDTTKGGKAPRVFDFASGVVDGRWSQEKFANLINAIIDLSNEIATQTLRGPGNFCVVSPRIATALQAAGPQFTAITADVNASTTMAEIGKLNGTITVYRDLYAPGDYVLVGFKGPTISDTGLVYSPYITGLFNRAVNPDNFGINVGVMSRYAITDSLLGSGRYYRSMIVKNIASVIPS